MTSSNVQRSLGLTENTAPHVAIATLKKGIIVRRSESRLQGLHVNSTSTAAANKDGCTGAQAQQERIRLNPMQQAAEGSFQQTQPETSQQATRQDQIQVCDKIIAIFRARPSSDWRRLIAFSKQWNNLSDSLFARLDSRLRQAEDQKERSDLKKLNRKLKEVHKELQGHNQVLAKFLTTPENEWEGLVTSGRGSLSTSFFTHLENLVRASQDDIPKRDELARIATRLLMLVDALDKVVENENAMQTAGQEFKTLLEGFLAAVEGYHSAHKNPEMYLIKLVTSIEDADAKIDQLAKNGKLDPALMLTMTKAYAAAKDTDYTKEQVKDVMAHLYHKAKESFVAQQPASVRILKHLLWIESPSQRREAMDQAFQPGPQMATPTQDFLSTTPQELTKVMEAILATYDASVQQSQSGAMPSQTQGLMNPQVIENMRNLLVEVRKQYL